HNPLASVRLGVQGLARDIRNGRCTPGEIGSYLDLIDNEIDKCIAVTHRLLMLSRTPEEAPQVVDLALALDDGSTLARAEPFVDAGVQAGVPLGRDFFLGLDARFVVVFDPEMLIMGTSPTITLFKEI
ncbi:MAG TPA: hypothetical protein PLW80_06040, partial [Spirochaetales bacterium]|nr:hypothetical protein [Spirochaetales bacterium]